MEHETVITYLDSYCERAGDAGMWAEPLNAATNLFFLLAAMAALWSTAKLSKHKLGDIPDIWLLIASLTGIAVGSGLWHLVPTSHTVMMDVLPITAFIHIYLIAALRRLLGMGWGKILVLMGLYIAVGDIAAQTYLSADLLNGTIMYVPTYLVLVGLTAAVWRRDAAMGRVFLNVVMVWTASLIFRTIDTEICADFPIGTHFLWHMLNAWVLYRLLLVLVHKAK